MGFVLRIHVPAKAPRGEDARLFAARLAFRDDDDDVLRSDDMMMMMMMMMTEEKSGSRYDSSFSAFVTRTDAAFFSQTRQRARAFSLSLSLSLSLATTRVLERVIQCVTKEE